MNAKLAQDISQISDVCKALSLLAAAGRGSCVLHISCDSVQALMALSDGHIVAACTSSGESGFTALSRIMLLEQSRLQLLSRRPPPLEATEPISVGITEAIAAARLSLTPASEAQAQAAPDFEAIDPVLSKPVPTLTEQQKQLLEIARTSMSDRELFDEHLGVLRDDKGMFLSDQQLAELGEALLKMSPEQQKELFAQRHEQLSLPGDDGSQFYAFVDFEQQPEVPEELDAIPTPNVLPEDYDPLMEGSRERLAVEKQKPLTAQQKFIELVRERRKIVRKIKADFPTGKVMIAGCIAFLCFGVFVIPDMIKASATNAAGAFGHTHLIFLLQEEAWDLVPNMLRQFDLFVDSQQSPGISLTLSPVLSSDSEGSTRELDKLDTARRLVAEGQIDAAIDAYKTFIAANPDRIDVRIEYTRALFKAGRRDKARVAAMDALKRHVTAVERDTLWALIRACVFSH